MFRAVVVGRFTGVGGVSLAGVSLLTGVSLLDAPRFLPGRVGVATLGPGSVRERPGTVSGKDVG